MHALRCTPQLQRYPTEFIRCSTFRGEERERLPFGHTTPPSSTYDYTCTHGTDVQSAGLIMLEDFVLVSATPSRIAKRNSGYCCVRLCHAGDCRNRQSTSWQITPRDAQRGSTASGFRILKPKLQHFKIDFRDMHREAYIVGQKGIVRAAEKWGWQAGHFSITGNPKSLQTILRSFESCKHLQLLFTFAISLPTICKHLQLLFHLHDQSRNLA